MEISAFLIHFLSCAALCHMINSQSCPSTGVPACSASSEYAMIPANHTGTSNYVYLAGLFGVHDALMVSGYGCGDVSEVGIQHLEAFLWAVDTFQQRYPGKLEDLSVGALAFDTCTLPEKGIQQMLNFLQCDQIFSQHNDTINPENALAFIGPGTLRETRQLGSVLSQMKRTLITASVGESSLRDDNEGLNLNYVLRTVPQEGVEVDTILALLEEAGWQYIQVLHSSDEYGHRMHNALMQAMADRTDICAVNTIAYPTSGSNADLNPALSTLQENPDTKVVLLLMDTSSLALFLPRAAVAYTRGQFIWVAPSTWGNKPEVIDNIDNAIVDALTFQLDVANREFTTDFVTHFEGLSSDEIRNPWFSEYEALGSNPTLDPYTPFVIQAVDAALLGIHIALEDTCDDVYLCNSFINNDNKWAIIHDKIRNIDIPNSVRFDPETGDQLEHYLTLNRVTAPNSINRNYHYQEVGTYIDDSLTLQPRALPNVESICAETPCQICGETTSQSTVTNTFQTSLSTEPANRGNRDPPLELREGLWVVVLLIICGLGIFFVFIFEVVFMTQLAASTLDFKRMWLGQLLLVSLFLSYLSLFAFVVSPTDASCGAIRFCVGVCYAMIFAVLLVKLLILLSSKSIGYLKGIFQVLMFIFAWGVQIAIDVEWLILREPEAVYKVKDDEWVCSQGFDTHVTTLSYVMFLLIICTILAFKAKNIVTNHRESIYILVTCCLILPIFLIWLLLGFLTSGNDYADPCLAFGLFATTTIVLLVMFLPKIHQLCCGNVQSSWGSEDGSQYKASILTPNRPIQIIDKTHAVQAAGPYMTSQRVEPVAPPVVYVDDVDMGLYSEPIDSRQHITHHKDPGALYLRHPGNPRPSDLSSVRSMPIGRAGGGGGASVYSLPVVNNTRVLHVTGDLVGRSPNERKARSEVNYPIGYGTTRSTRSAKSGTSGRNGSTSDYYSLRRPRSLKDLGSL